ncbi:hypothetical protein [Pseudomonas sp. 18175]|uniref:hypothetical protein n=1 Tax=Pseudomonas sp. 18175 TaxID=3390056 RepID=UPI003D23D6D3
MTGDTFWKSWWAILFSAGPIFVGMVFIVNSLYISRYLPVMIKALENSRQIILYSRILKGMGVFGEICLVTQIAGMLIWPKVEIRMGLLDSRDVTNFPLHLLRLLKMNMALLVISIVWLVVVCVVLKFR